MREPTGEDILAMLALMERYTTKVSNAYRNGNVEWRDLPEWQKVVRLERIVERWVAQFDEPTTGPVPPEWKEGAS